MKLDIWKRDDKDTESIVYCPSFKAKLIFLMNGCREIGSYRYKGSTQSGFILCGDDRVIQETIKTLKILKETKGVDFDNDGVDDSETPH